MAPISSITRSPPGARWAEYCSMVSSSMSTYGTDPLSAAIDVCTCCP